MIPNGNNPIMFLGFLMEEFNNAESREVKREITHIIMTYYYRTKYDNEVQEYHALKMIQPVLDFFDEDLNERLKELSK